MPQDGVGNWHSCGALSSGAATFTNNELSITYTNGDNGRYSTIKYVWFDLDPFNRLVLTPSAAATTCPAPSTVPLVCVTKSPLSPLGMMPLMYILKQEPGGKLYTLTFKSKVGCYKGQGGGGGSKDEFDAGWVFVIMCASPPPYRVIVSHSLSVLCGLTVYFIVGFAFLKFARGAEGVEAIPQGEFWLSLPGLVKDGYVVELACICAAVLFVCCVLVQLASSVTSVSFY